MSTLKFVRNRLAEAKRRSFRLKLSFCVLQKREDFLSFAKLQKTKSFQKSSLLQKTSQDFTCLLHFVFTSFPLRGSGYHAQS